MSLLKCPQCEQYKILRACRLPWIEKGSGVTFQKPTTGCFFDWLNNAQLDNDTFERVMTIDDEYGFDVSMPLEGEED
ncbi:hypothetical protein P4E94_14775 [Pontiellaceae bacterium B12219]|nr:hypothetical protein [Pontiellaceae bacterium B12219]